MWISDLTSTSRPQLGREIGALTLAGVGLALVLSPADPTLSTWPVHPAWVLAMVIAARYGARGMWMVPALALGLLASSLVVGGDAAAAFTRLSRGGDLAALATTALCAAVGAAHEHRRAALARRLAEAEARAQSAELAVTELSETALALRDRSDHCTTSLAFLADVALRIDGRDPRATGEAALELAQARTGATGGFIQVREPSGRMRTLASSGPVALRDLTAEAAVQRGVVVSADETQGARPEDSDLAAPLVDDTGRVLGVLALHGVHYALLSTTVRAEIAGVARWVATSLAAAEAPREAEAVRGVRGSGSYSFSWGKRRVES